jgi:hypothetical protein
MPLEGWRGHTVEVCMVGDGVAMLCGDGGMMGTARPYCYEDGGAMPLGRIFIGTIQIHILDHNQLHIFEVSIGIHP